MIQRQDELDFSPYSQLYDLVVPRDHLLRKLNGLIDFSFVYDELRGKYCQDNGRNAVDPIRMFKYLLLKVLHDLSDVDVVERSRYDLSYKYFLGMAPEDPVINPSSLTKFRKLRLKDANLLDLLIGKTLEIALDRGIIKKRNTVIVDSTHTKARYNQKSQVEVLKDLSKNLRKAVYAVDASMKSTFPVKPTVSDLQDEINYGKRLIEAISQQEVLQEVSSVRERLNLLRETIEDDLERLFPSKEPDARVGHKSADSAFFGYKSHLAMTEERIITAAVITSGDKNDGKQLPQLIEKAQAAGIEIEAVVGDAAYSGKDNIEMAEEQQYKLVSKLNPIIMEGSRKKEDEFEYNKDAGMFVCKAGHMAVRKARQGTKDVGSNRVVTYYFDIEKCKRCPLSEGCYKPGAKSRTYSISIKSTAHTQHAEFQESEYFKTKARERYKIEAKNSELKNRHGYGVAQSGGITNMNLQGAITIFTVNMKRIIKLMH